MQSLDDIFIAAREIASSSARAAYLTQACGGDADLRHQVEAMLADAAGADDFFGAAAVARREVPGLPEEQGAVIGRYKLLQKIGEGGMGVVYMAEQREPVVRRVALKIIKAGMDTRQVVARFEAERQALALMDHANIARVFDGGVVGLEAGVGSQESEVRSLLSPGGGRPYFVMELVQGLTITQFCDEARLPTRQRLELFLDVCSAVQHAHQKGIIHRDIKPSNILVTLHGEKPVAKVIDFGIAKATQQRLTDKTVFTQFQHFIGTPAYMSPEQASLSGLDLDTRSDIYALGVLLYELLTGTTPFDGKELVKSGLDEMRRIICEKEPLRPSTRLRVLSVAELTTTAERRRIEGPRLVSALRSDLDWIVMKCLEKDRARRYETANGLAADVRRHLSDEPIIARPPSAAYRMQKAVLRNRGAFFAAVSIVVLLTTGVVVSALLASRARQAQRRADMARGQETRLRQAAERAAQEARQNLYGADMLLAQQALAENNWGQVRLLLQRHIPAEGEPDLRGWEWRYLWAQSRSEALFDLGRHEGSVLALAVSPGGTFLASAGSDRVLRLFDLRTRRELARWQSASVEATPDSIFDSPGLQFSPQGDVLGVSFSSTGLILLEVPSLRMSRLIPAQSYTSFVFSTNGHRVLLFGTNGITSCELRTDDRIKIEPGPDPSASWGTVAPDERHFVSVNPIPKRLAERVSVWDRKSSLKIGTWDQALWWIQPVGFSPDGRSVAVAGCDNDDHGLIVVFDLHNNRERWRATNLGMRVTAVDFSPDSQTMAASSTDHLVRVWQVDDGRELTTLRGHQDEPHAVRFSADGQMLFVGDKLGGIRAWSASERVPASTFHPVPPKTRWRAISADGRRMLNVTEDGAVEFSTQLEPRVRWDLPKGTNVAALTLSSDGTFAAIANRTGEMELWNPASGSMLRNIESLHPRTEKLLFSPDANSLVGATAGGRVAIWNVTSGRIVFSPELGFPDVSAFALSPDGRRLAAASTKGRVAVWDVVEARPMFALTLHASQIPGLAFSPDGRQLASASWDARVKVLDVNTRQILAVLTAHRNIMDSVSYSADGRRLVATGPEGEVYLFETQQFQRVARIKLDCRQTTTAWLTPDGKSLIADEYGYRKLFVVSAPLLTELQLDSH